MSGADWDTILSETPSLDFEGVDIDAIVSKLNTFPTDQKDSLVARLQAEKAKVKKRGDVVDTALDIFLAVLDVAT